MVIAQVNKGWVATGRGRRGCRKGTPSVPGGGKGIAKGAEL